MKLSLHNVGNVKEATVELNGITVIAGENNTGKSTVGKALYCVFNSCYKLEEQIKRERDEAIENAINRSFSMPFRAFTEENILRNLINDITNGSDKYRIDIDSLKTLISEFFTNVEKGSKRYRQYINIRENKGYVFDEEVANAAERIGNILEISDKEVTRSILSKVFEAEFDGQVNNLFGIDTAEIVLKNDSKKLMVRIKNDSVESFVGLYRLETEIIYIDDPYVLDTLELYHYGPRRHSGGLNHRGHLASKINRKESDAGIISEIIVEEKLKKVYSIINGICDGEVVRVSPAEWGYRLPTAKKALSIKNMSTGLKTFAILKTLLQKSVLEENGTIVLDEPEIHLHPEWQLLFAELIILLQKEFDIHVLLNTHSPYFLNAIEVYAAKYEIADRCKYYLAEIRPKGKSAVIRDVSDNIELIYKKLARPLQTLENERAEIDD